MPFLRIDVIEGRDEADIRKLLDSIHRSVVEAFDVPERDRYQVIHQHPAHEMVVQDTGLGFERSQDVVVIQMTSSARSEKQKKLFYRTLADRLKEDCGIVPEDIMVSIVTNGAGDWSFGYGEAQFLTGRL